MEVVEEQSVDWKSLLTTKQEQLKAVERKRSALAIEVRGIERILAGLGKPADAVVFNFSDPLLIPPGTVVEGVNVHVVGPTPTLRELTEDCSQRQERDLKTRILAFVGAQQFGVDAVAVATAVGLTYRKASIALSQYAKAGLLERQRGGVYVRALPGGRL